jgi:ubiquinone/menaquinone biosynthesis C-methylase UbiE
MLQEFGISVTAVDVSSAMLDVAKERKPSIRDSVNWVTADASKLPFPDDSVDAVLSIRLMNHLPVSTRAQVLKQFARIARSRVLVAFTDVTSLQGWLRAGERRRRNVNQYPADVSRARQELASAGLRLLSTKHLMWGISETYMCVAEVVDRA